MYERFTDRARKVMQLANQEAQRFNHEFVAPAHMLVALAKEGSGIAAHVLKSRGHDLRAIRLAIEAALVLVAGPDMILMGRLPMTPAAKETLERAIKIASEWQHNYVGTEHLLVAIVRETKCGTAELIKLLGIDCAAVERECRELCSRTTPENKPDPPDTHPPGDRPMKDHGMTITDLDESELRLPHATKPESCVVVRDGRENIETLHAAIIAMIDRAVASAKTEPAIRCVDVPDCAGRWLEKYIGGSIVSVVIVEASEVAGLQVRPHRKYIGPLPEGV